ncbi:MAG: hypothetical protein M0Z75_08925 [Nitrospiraceae bacterium]|nr:hypothetical protein [Nitrospiraceae bacterium]
MVEKDPDTFSSFWVLKHAPQCYRFICKNIRTETGRIDWDRVTFALEKKFQRRWMPGRKANSPAPYEDPSEVDAVLNKYQDKLYVFLVPSEQGDRLIRNMISISLVRLAQYGNLSAKQEAMKLVGYTIDGWIERYRFMSRWQGYGEEIQKNLERCIRRYRYTGSFLNYLFRTLQYAGRGLPPVYECSLDEPVAAGSRKSRLEYVYEDDETNEIRIHRG